VPEAAGPVTGAGSNAQSPPFACSWRAGHGGAAWIHVDGELGTVALPQFEATLREARQGARLVVLDLRELTFIASPGVHVILAAAREARRDGQALMLARGPAHVDRVFALTGASTCLSIFDLDPAEPAPALYLG